MGLARPRPLWGASTHAMKTTLRAGRRAAPLPLVPCHRTAEDRRFPTTSPTSLCSRACTHHTRTGTGVGRHASAPGGPT